MRDREIKESLRANRRALGAAMAAATMVGLVGAAVLVFVVGPARGHGVSVNRLAEQASVQRTRAFERHELQARRRWLNRPAVKRQRAASQTAYRGLDARASRALFVRDFHGAIRRVIENPASSRVVKGHVLRYLNDSSAIVSVGHFRHNVYSSVPLRARNASGRLAPIDLSIVRRGHGFSAANPVQPVGIGARVSDGVAIGSSGFGMTIIGADRPGEFAGQAGVFYPDVMRDVDASVVPTIGGAEMFAMLRSRLGPHRLSYKLSLPAHATAQQTHGTIVVARGKRTLATIRPVVARDAQGTTVPTSASLKGGRLVVSIDAKPGRYAYPILVDPEGDVPPSDDGWSLSTSGLNSGETASGGPNTLTLSTDGTRDTWPPTNGQACERWTPPAEEASDPIAYVEMDDVQITWNAQGPPYGTDDDPFDNGTEFGAGFGGWRTDSTAECGESGTIGSRGWSAPATLTGETTAGWPVLTGNFSSSGGAPQGVMLDMGAYTSQSNSNEIPAWANSEVGAILVETGYSTHWLTGTSSPPPPCPGPACQTGGHPNTAEWAGPSNDGEPGQQRCNHGDPVNCATGNRYETATDLTLGGRNGGLTLTRTYNSQGIGDQPGMFGYGWTSAYTAHLATDQASGDVIVFQDNGSTTAFAGSGAGFSPISPLTQATLVQDPDGDYVYTLPDQSTLQFDSTGQLRSETDPYGNATSLAYDGHGRLETISNTADQAISLTYNADGTVAQASDSAGQHVDYGYTSGDLTSFTDVAGHAWSYGYDAAHDLTTNSDPLGHTVTTAYDSQNRVVSQTDAMDRTSTWAYSTGMVGDQTVLTEPSGQRTIYQFDSASHQPSSIIRADGSSQFFYYDNQNNLTAVRDGDGFFTRYGYDGAGNMTSRTDPGFNTTRWTYDARHDVTSMTDPLGRITTYGYTGDELTSITETHGSDSVDTNYGYNPHGDLTSFTDPDGNTWHYGYDDAGNRTSQTAPGGEQTTWGYDANEYLTSTTSPGNHTTTYTNNPYGQPTEILDPLGHDTHASYDAAGNVTSETDPDGHTTGSTYDADSERTQITQPDGTTLSTSYTSDGQVATQTDGAGRTTSYQYNTVGELVSSKDPLNRTTSYSYDPAGKLTTTTDAQGRTTTLRYNQAQVSQVSYSDGTPAAAFGYDGDGERTSMSDGSGWTSYNHDPLGRLSSITDGNGHTIGYGRDPNGNVTSITYPNGKTVDRQFDTDGRLTGVTDWLGNTTSFAYDTDSNLTTTTFPEPTQDTDSYGYNSAGQLDSVQIDRASSPLASLSYTLDADGLVTGDTETGLPHVSGQADRDYGYDNANNLTQLDGSNGYTYDQANELTSSPTQNFNYDQSGERTSATPIDGGDATTYAYDQSGRLSTYTPVQGDPTNFAYDGDGLRTSSTQGDTTTSFTWDQTSGLPLMLSDSTNSYIYGPGGLPVEQIDNDNRPSYLHHDQLGSTRLITNSAGSLTGAISYDPYGASAAESGAATTPLGYAGQYTDPNGLQYDRARYYDPTTGQFLTRDPLQAYTGEPYGYAGNNPLSNTDPTGLSFLDDLGNAAAGFGDTVTLGGTSWVRKQLGWDNVNYCSSSYGAGGAGGLAVTAFIPGEGEAELAAEGATRIFRAGSEIGGSGISLDEAEAAATRNGLDMRMFELRHEAGGGAYGYISQTGSGALVRGSTGRILLTLQDAGLASEQDAVETIAHELNHVRGVLTTGDVTSEAAAEAAATSAGQYFR
jgi:RHS repeat-associated protein